eukprot:TRINITY_DN4085_c0_g1_i1.p3 TRINITY_DN4085_c0_g1~~TRINITY_DN4085_c0_g1_i1.p3  ORF type:complete len:107 (-),score=20.12 TRINITY_DN4085_c0_g1_i1:35-355(-)
MEQYVQEKSGRSKCDVVWGTECSQIELKYIDKWVGLVFATLQVAAYKYPGYERGPDVARDQQKLVQEKQKWDNELRAPPILKTFAQNKQRVMILGQLLEAWQNPNL